MADVIETRLVVLGAGPGGYPAAFLAADRGMKVTLIDARERPGGTCLHVGCIPSKAVLHAAKLITDARDALHIGLDFGKPKIDINGVRGHWQKVVDTLTGNLGRLSKARKIDYVVGRGKFIDGRTIEVEGRGRCRFENCIVATGSVPAVPPSLNLASPRVMDSTGALKLEDLPPRLLVVGGGYIGLEMGYVYAALGSKVTVVEMTDGLLPGCDRDLVLPLHKRLEKIFDKIYLKTKVAKLEETPQGIRATLEGEEVADKQPIFERVLVAVGRRPNSRDIGLDKAGVEIDEKGFIKVDERRRTTAEHIYAIGDVAGEPMLAHKATYEGKIAVEVIAGEPAVYDARAVPAVVFTDPEVAWCGLTETEAKRENREIKRVRFPWAGSGRAMTLDRTEGLTKLIVDPETDRVLGVGIVGAGAGEMIAEAMLAIEMAASARDLAMTMHAHPTLSETIMEAAESLYGLAVHQMPAKK
ncbi:MAG TPA: dihydrolipoyl dehydrogenase [Gemmataceae bacterium]|nr:dihydrolipoyl dehydrogenase [Gemmataceae bacterium]